MKLQKLAGILAHFAPRKIYFALFLNGFILASAVYCRVEDRHEKQVFHAIASYIEESIEGAENSEEARFKKSMEETYKLGTNRVRIFGNNIRQETMKSIIHPATYDLQTATSACGSFSIVLCRLLNEMNIETRIAQMKSGNNNAAHIIVEAKASYGWVVLDPSFNLLFKREDGRLASFNEIKGNWSRYSKQVPENYNPAYRYEGVRYTNWNSVPVIMPVIKKLLDWNMGKAKADQVSMRNIFIRKFHILYIVFLSLFITLSVRMLYRYIRSKIVVLTSLRSGVLEAHN